MASADFTFITLRNMTAYQPTGSYVPQNYVLTMSTNGAAVWSNTITFNTLTASTIVGNSILGNAILSTDILGGSTIVGSTIYGANVGANYMECSTILGSTIIGNNINSMDTLGASTINASTIIGGNFAVLSTIALASSFFSTVSDYTYTGSNTISSMLIGIGENIWKIPVEFVGAAP